MFEALGLSIDGPGFDKNEQYKRVECPFVLNTFRMWREQPLRAKAIDGGGMEANRDVTVSVK